jgi:hypothetical protein
VWQLQAAGAKLDQRKYTDALGKLQDFQIAVITMRDAAKPKLSAPDAGLLLDTRLESATPCRTKASIEKMWLPPRRNEPASWTPSRGG